MCLMRMKYVYISKSIRRFNLEFKRQIVPHWLTGAVPTHQSAVATLAAIWVFGPGNYREGSVGFSVS